VHVGRLLDDLYPQRRARLERERLRQRAEGPLAAAVPERGEVVLTGSSCSSRPLLESIALKRKESSTLGSTSSKQPFAS